MRSLVVLAVLAMAPLYLSMPLSKPRSTPNAIAPAEHDPSVGIDEATHKHIDTVRAHEVYKSSNLGPPRRLQARADSVADGMRMLAEALKKMAKGLQQIADAISLRTGDRTT